METEIPLDPSPGSGPRGAPPLETFLLPPLRSWHWILLVALLGAGFGAFLGAVRPNTYTSIGKVLVRLGEREQSTAETAIEGERLVPRTAREDMQNEVHLLKDLGLFEEVAKTVGPDTILRIPDPSADVEERTSFGKRALFGFQSWWFRSHGGPGPWNCPDSATCANCIDLARAALVARTEIRLEPNSNVISVAHTAPDPEVARLVVKSFLDAFETRHAKVYESNVAYGFLSGEYDQATRDAGEADRALSQYSNDCGIHDLSAQRTSVLEEIASLEEELIRDLSRFRFLLGQYAYYAPQLQAEKPTVEQVVGRNLVPHPLRTGLEMEILSLRAERLELLLRFNEDSREVGTKDEQISQAQGKLDATPITLDVGEQVAVVRNPNFDRILATIQQIIAEGKGLEVSRPSREARLTELHQKLQRIEDCAPELLRLQRESQVKSARVANLRDSLERARVKSALDRDKITNLRRIAEPTRPLEKTGPRRSLFVAGGAFLGLLAGLGLAFARHALDPTLRRPPEVERALGIPLLAVVPELRELRGRTAAVFEERVA